MGGDVALTKAGCGIREKQGLNGQYTSLVRRSERTHACRLVAARGGWFVMDCATRCKGAFFLDCLIGCDASLAVGELLLGLVLQGKGKLVGGFGFDDGLWEEIAWRQDCQTGLQSR